MQRAEIVDAVIAERDDATVVVSPGASSGLVYSKDQHPATIYSMTLGYTTAFAYGIALAHPERRVITLEGDGSMFAGIQVLGTLARYPVANLTIIVVANGIWGTGDGNVATTPGTAAQLAEIARGCGLDEEHVFVATEAPTLRAILARTKSETGPWIVCAVTERSSGDKSGAHVRVPLDAIEDIDLTRRYLRDRS